MRKLDIPATTAELVEFIDTTVTNAGVSRVVIGLSGGVDSATAISLAVAALGPEGVFPMLLPYQDWEASAVLRARVLLRELRIPASNIHEIDIAPMVAGFLAALGLAPAGPETGAATSLARVRIGNIMARVRMVLLFDHAKHLPALVVGTENRSEHLLGYYTRYGDAASDLEPLRNLYKTEIFRLARHLRIPSEILDVAPTAGLWQGQTDEDQFGFTYEAADEILQGLFDDGLSPGKLVESGLDQETIDAVIAWLEQVAFKRQMPIVPPER